jgi:hypothetical protein
MRLMSIGHSEAADPSEQAATDLTLAECPYAGLSHYYGGIGMVVDWYRGSDEDDTVNANSKDGTVAPAGAGTRRAWSIALFGLSNAGGTRRATQDPMLNAAMPLGDRR